MKWLTLMKDELNSLEHKYSFSIILFGLLLCLHLLFQSGTLKVALFMTTKDIFGTSFYHIVTEYILLAIYPLLCIFLMYDAIYRDVEDERVRMLLTKISRGSYLFGKYSARLAVMIFSLFIILLFVALYSLITTSHMFFLVTAKLFIMYFLCAMLIASLMLAISAFTKNPLFVGLLIPTISLSLLGSNIGKWVSLYFYLQQPLLIAATFFIAISIIGYVVTYIIFKRQHL
jgi:ABC-2 type transport system permease protein